MKRKRWIKRTLLVGVSVCLACLVAECSMITFESYLPPGSSWEYERTIGFRVRPGAMNSNEFGFRDRDYPHEKTAGKQRILFLGDSFNWAGAVNYVDIVRHLVKREFPDREIDVINAGYPMTHTGEQVEILKSYALKYDPDLVILGFFAGNDFLDADPFRKRLVLNDCFYDIDVREESFLFGFPMVPRSRLLTFLSQKLRISSSVEMLHDPQMHGSQHGRGIPELEVPEQGVTFGIESDEPADSILAALRILARICPSVGPESSMTPESYRSLVAGKMVFCSRVATDAARFESNIEFALSKIDEMFELLRERDIGFFVGMFPDEFQVSPEVRKSALEEIGRKEGDYDMMRAQNLLSAHLAGRKIRHLDLHPILEMAQSVRACYTPRNTHWNLYGNYVVGHAYYHLVVKPYITR